MPLGSRHLLGATLLFLAYQERDQVDKLILRQTLLQPFRHRAERGQCGRFDILLRKLVLRTLIVGKRQHRLVLTEFDATERLARLELDHVSAEAWCDGSARFEDRLNKVNA